jgi:hypothetical protein
MYKEPDQGFELGLKILEFEKIVLESKPKKN